MLFMQSPLVCRRPAGDHIAWCPGLQRGLATLTSQPFPKFQACAGVRTDVCVQLGIHKCVLIAGALCTGRSTCYRVSWYWGPLSGEEAKE